MSRLRIEIGAWYIAHKWNAWGQRQSNAPLVPVRLAGCWRRVPCGGKPSYVLTPHSAEAVPQLQWHHDSTEVFRRGLDRLLVSGPHTAAELRQWRKEQQA